MAITRGWSARALALLGMSLLCGELVAVERPLALNQRPETETNQQDSRQENDKTTADASISKADQAAALAFVKEHHPELANLLRVLRTMNEPQFRNAIRDLNRARNRLEQVRRRSEERYEHELQVWQAKSRIQLLTARLQVNDSPALRNELTTAFRELAELRLATLRAERQRLQERLTKVEEQLDRLGEDPSAEAERQLQLVLKRLDESKRNGTNTTVPPLTN